MIHISDEEMFYEVVTILVKSFATLCGLGNLDCGLGNLKVWSTFDNCETLISPLSCWTIILKSSSLKYFIVLQKEYLTPFNVQSYN